MHVVPSESVQRRSTQFGLMMTVVTFVFQAKARNFERRALCAAGGCSSLSNSVAAAIDARVASFYV